MNELVLALETSTRVPSIALRRGETTLTAELESSRAHASDLLPTLARLFAEIGARASELTRIAVGVGPGSYTGLRVGAATALGLARASGAELVSVPSTEALVFGATEVGREASVVIDARAGELYFARYRREERGVTTLDEPCVVVAAELASRIPSGSLVFADDDAVRAAGLGERSDLVLERGARPHARATLELGLARAASRSIEPLYLRAFAAKSRRR